MKAKIINVDNHSPSARSGVCENDILIELNGKTEFDILDYIYAQADERVYLKLLTENNITKDICIQNDEYLPLGISFEDITVDKPHECRNNCIFCFMAQMPKGLRDTLYFKDDDYRLSFICGNYVTLTNVSDEELKRIARLNIDRLNISVHTTNPALRREMMRNKNAEDIKLQLDFLKKSGIDFNLQFVLCPGLNDGEYLKQSLNDCLEYADNIVSLSCVPVGLTKYREGLYPLRAFCKAEAAEICDTVSYYSQKARQINDRTRFCASDEFFILAERSFPQSDYYNDYAQFENGVGMSRSFIDETNIMLSEHKRIANAKGFEAVIVTGVLGEKVISEPIRRINEQYATKMAVRKIENDFFGKSVTASGLVCGKDIIGQLKGINIPIVIPSNMLKDDEDVFLDNISVTELEEKLNVKCYIISPDAQGLYELLRSV